MTVFKLKYVHNAILLNSRNKRNRTTDTMWMDLENIVLSEVSQKERLEQNDPSHMLSIKTHNKRTKNYIKEWHLRAGLQIVRTPDGY